MRRPRRARQRRGPAARMQQAFHRLQAAQQGRDPLEVFDARDEMRLAQQAFERALQRQQAGSRPARRAREDGGGAGDAFGALTGSLKAATAIVIGFGVSLDRAARSIQQFGAERGMAGATTGETAAFAALTGSPRGFAARAAELTHLLATDIYAMRQSASGRQLARPFGPVNEGAILIRELRALRGMRGDPVAQLRRARALHLEWALDFVKVSQNVWDAAERLTGTMQRVFTPENEQAARDFAGWTKVIGGQLQALSVTLAMPTIRTLNRSFEVLSKNLERLQKQIEGMDKASTDWLARAFELSGKTPETSQRWAKGMLDLFKSGPLVGFPALIDAFQRILKGQDPFPKPPPDPTQAQNKNTQALVDLTEVLQMIAGGGRRVRGAVPAGLMTASNRQAAIDAALDLRGFRTL